jgi:hypothetical protein
MFVQKLPILGSFVYAVQVGNIRMTRILEDKAMRREIIYRVKRSSLFTNGGREYFPKCGSSRVIPTTNF